MRPTVEAAWIAAGGGLLGVLVGVAGTVIVGIAGFRNTRSATDKTVSAAHTERVWDRKADAYQEALAASLWRNHRRMYLTHTELSEEQYAEAANALFLMQTEQDWWMLQGRLGTFGSPSVVGAYNKSLLATEYAHRRHDEWRQARGIVQDSRKGRGTTAAGVDANMVTVAEALTTFKNAMAQAQNADYALERAIRYDLNPDEPISDAQVFTNLNQNAIQDAK
jgi:hypothetical protein